MKKILCLIAIIYSTHTFAQFTERLQAFDACLNMGMSERTGQDGGVQLTAGVSGRRIPVSLMAGINYMEFDNAPQVIKSMNVQSRSAMGYNATVMLRCASIQFRSMDWNAYSTVYKDNNVYLYEYGIKTGVLLNDRSRMYFSLGHIQDKENNYHSFVVGASFSMFFWNGYSAY